MIIYGILAWRSFDIGVSLIPRDCLEVLRSSTTVSRHIATGFLFLDRNREGNSGNVNSNYDIKSGQQKQRGPCRGHEWRYMLKAETNRKQNQRHQTIPHDNIRNQAISRTNGQ